VETQAEIAIGSPTDAQRSEPIKDASALPKSARGRRRGKQRLLTRDQLDGRTLVAREYDRLEAAIIADLGGDDAISAIERSLVEGFCGATVVLKDINARLALGQAIEVADLAQTISSMVRVAGRLGEQRRQRVINGGVHPQELSPFRRQLQDAVDAEDAAAVAAAAESATP
jgi:hypothetical protein